jgi:hypothetical protein
MKRRPGEVGLNGFSAMVGESVAYAFSKNSIIFSPFFRTT